MLPYTPAQVLSTQYWPYPQQPILTHPRVFPDKSGNPANLAPHYPNSRNNKFIQTCGDIFPFLATFPNIFKQYFLTPVHLSFGGLSTNTCIYTSCQTKQETTRKRHAPHLILCQQASQHFHKHLPLFLIPFKCINRWMQLMCTNPRQCSFPTTISRAKSNPHTNAEQYPASSAAVVVARMLSKSGSIRCSMWLVSFPTNSLHTSSKHCTMNQSKRNWAPRDEVEFPNSYSFLVTAHIPHSWSLRSMLHSYEDGPKVSQS